MAAKDSAPAEEETQTSAEDSESTSVSSWLSGWYDTAKQKLAETNEFMRHDIQEFTQAVQSDASKLVAATATTMKEKLNINVDLEEASAATKVVKDSLSNFLGTIASKVGPMRPDDDDNEDAAAYVGTASGTKVLSPSEARIFAIRTDPATFCNEPDSEKEFHQWLPEFNLEERKTEISSLMLDCSQIRSLYTKLVPAAVSHCDFWARYFFKIHQHEKAEQRRARLVQRAHETHDDIEWEDDEDDDWVQPATYKDKSLPERSTPVAADELKENEPSTTNDKNKTVNEKTEVASEPETIEMGRQAGENTETKIISDVATESHKAEKLPEPADEVIKSAQANPDVLTEVAASNEDVDRVSNKTLPTAEENENNSPPAEPSFADQTKPKKDGSTHQSLNNKAENETEAKNITNKTPSSGESSDDWEKDFDLDMTEDEIQQALKESDEVDVGDIEEDWEEWE